MQAIEPAVARPQASAPRDAPARPGADVPGLPATASRRSATVMWMIPALFGLAGASLIFAGTKTRERRWLTAGIVYLVLVLAGWIWSSAHPEDHPLDYFFVGGWFVAWIVSSIHLFLIRPAYLAKVAAQHRSA